MNVFVLCTGRCGSTTFSKAASHMTNITAGHETRCSLIGNLRLAYPPSHIEVDNRLSWFLGRLDCTYGKNACYVHLQRDLLDSVVKLKTCYNLFTYNEERAYGGTSKS